MDSEMPVFVKIDEYKEVLDVLGLIKEKISQAQGILSKIEQLQSEEAAELDAWKKGLDEISAKVEHIDQRLLEPEN